MAEYYKNQYNKFDIVRELLAMRYMITTQMVMLNNICYYLEGREKALRALLPEEKKKTLHTSIKFLDEVEFNHFKLSARYFNALVKRFNQEAVANACILMDEYIKDNPDKQLSQPQINKRIKEYTTKYSGVIDTNKYLAEAIEKSSKLDYKLIDNETIARQYIASIPFYMRSVNLGVQYLKEKFGI